MHLRFAYWHWLRKHLLRSSMYLLRAAPAYLLRKKKSRAYSPRTGYGFRHRSSVCRLPWCWFVCHRFHVREVSYSRYQLLHPMWSVWKESYLADRGYPVRSLPFWVLLCLYWWMPREFWLWHVWTLPAPLAGLLLSYYPLHSSVHEQWYLRPIRRRPSIQFFSFLLTN